MMFCVWYCYGKDYNDGLGLVCGGTVTLRVWCYCGGKDVNGGDV